jgi:hypothetical protein
MDATLEALRDSLKSISSLEESIHKEPNPSNPAILSAQVINLSRDLNNAYQETKAVDNALMVKVKPELIILLDQKLGPDLYKKKIMEDTESRLRAIAERASYLSELQARVLERVAGDQS